MKANYKISLSWRAAPARLKKILVSFPWLILLIFVCIFLLYAGWLYYRYVWQPFLPNTSLLPRQTALKTNLFEKINEELTARQKNLKDGQDKIYLDPFR